MDGILINPFDRTVAAVEVEDGLDAIYAALSRGPVKVGTIQCIQMDVVGRVRNTLYIDDNGLLHEPPVEHFFMLPDYPQPLAGCGLILGTNRAGDSISTTYKAGPIRMLIGFRDDIVHAGFVRSTSTVDHPLLGPGTRVFTERAIFKPK